MPGAGSIAPSIFGTPIPTVTPTATATETPIPTPTPAPLQVIGVGDRQLRNGDWDSALAAFQQALADPGADANARGAALLGVAESSLRRGDFAGAQSSLDQFFVDFPGHPQAARAYFLRGDARLGVSDWAGAISDYQTYLSMRPGLIDSYVYERIADSQLGLGQTDAAFQSYDQALASSRYFVGMLQLRERVASVHRALSQPDAAIAQYNAILEVAQNDGYRASIDYDIGQTLFEAGRQDEAYVQFDHVFMAYPTAFEAWSSLKTLRDAEIDVDQYQRGIVNFNQDKYDVAIEGFLNYWAANKPQAYTPESYLYIAKSYRQLGNPASTLTQLQVFQSRFDAQSGPSWGDSWLEIARSYADLGDPANAYLTYEKLAHDYPELPQAADGLLEAGQLALAQGDAARASGYFHQLAAAFPGDTRASAALFDAGVAAYLNADLATAETFFRSASELPANDRPAASHYWLGKTLLAAGRVDEGTAALNLASAADSPAGYYTVRAAELTSGRAPFTPPASFRLPSDPDEGRAEAEQWLVQRFGLTATPPLAVALRDDIDADPRIVRARELWDLGMVTDARVDFESVRQDLQDDPIATYQLAIYFRDIGLYRSSIIAAGRLLRLAQVTPFQAPPFLARLRYPTYFSDLVLSYAGQYQLDPLMVFSLIWQESTYEGFATSSASAQGLMQIWPPTGEDIAQRLAWPGYTPGDLQRPVVSVAFGTWLLNDDMARFEGDKYAVLSAYNAGPGRAAEWLAASQGDPDRFLQSVTLAEPKIYVERIVELYAIYSALYGVN